MVAKALAPLVFRDSTAGRRMAEVVAAATARPERMAQAPGRVHSCWPSASCFVADAAAARSKLNDPWLERFPDPMSRPARHTQKSAPGQSKVTCVFTAYIP